MNKLSITNIKQWKKRSNSRYIFYKPNKKKPTHEEGMYFNFNIFHYFVTDLNYSKEGIEICYGVRKNLYKLLTKNIEYE